MKCYVSQFDFVSTCELFISCSSVEVRLKTKVSNRVSRWIEVNAYSEGPRLGHLCLQHAINAPQDLSLMHNSTEYPAYLTYLHKNTYISLEHFPIVHLGFLS